VDSSFLPAVHRTDCDFARKDRRARRNERSALSVDYGSDQPGSNVSGAGAVNTTW